MDFSVLKVNLLSAIDKCAQAVDPKHQNPAFRMMRLEVKKKLKCFAVGEVCSVDTAVKVVAVKEPGSFNVVPGRLRDIASSMPDGEIRITMKGSRVTAKSALSARKATFESPVIDSYTVDDPGKDAPWQVMNCPELVRVIRTAKHASVPEQDDTVPAMLLIPTERGMDVFACNGYIITLTESSIRMSGNPIQFPLMASNIAALMAIEDADLRLFEDSGRLYLENNSTLASIRLTEYRLKGVFENLVNLLKDDSNVRGPVFKLGKLTESTKSVLAAGGFATSSERGSRGYQVRARFGPDTVSIALALSEADSEDQIEVVSPGAELSFGLSSSFFLKILDSLSGCDEVQALAGNNDNLLILRSKGIISGIMREGSL